MPEKRDYYHGGALFGISLIMLAATQLKILIPVVILQGVCLWLLLRPVKVMK